MYNLSPFVAALLLLFISLTTTEAVQGDTRVLTLEEAIDMAIDHSPAARQARNRYLSEYWNYRMHRANYLPSLELDATLPNFNRSISGVVQPDGSEQFHERNILRSTLGLSLNQRIPFTGGNLFLNTDLERLDNFEPQDITEYRATPVTIGIQQPLSLYNPYRWERRIRPVRYEESRRQYRHEVEQVKIQTVNHFFDAYLARINLDIAETNLANNDTLYQIAEGRYNLGNIAENELLQMELSFLNARNALSEAELTYQNNIYNLKSYLGIPKTETVELEIEHEVPDIDIQIEEAVQYALENNREPLAFERREKEAERDVAEARAGRFDINMFALYGLSNQSLEYNQVYRDPGDQQQFRVGFQMPILDWGRSKARREIAESQQSLVQTEVEKERRDFEHEVAMLVHRFRMNRENLEIAARADTVAQKRFEVTRERYMIGRIAITDLNIAMNEQERARQNYVGALRSFWNSYYNLRQITLYNFEEDEELSLPGRP